MKGNKLIWHQLVLILFLLILTGWRLLAGLWTLGVPVIWWWLGGVLGFLFVFLDRLVYALVTNGSDLLSVKVKDLLGQGKVVGGLALLLSEKEKQLHLMMRSALFAAVYLVLAFFTATSVANMFSRGLVLGMGIHLFFDLQWDFRGWGRNIHEWFWQIKRTLSPVEIRGFVWATTIVFLALAVFL